MNECRVLVILRANEQLAPAAPRSSAATRAHYAGKRGESSLSRSRSSGLASRRAQEDASGMTQKSSSSSSSSAVAAERRVDLASLFCMIGRHGPAVAVAVVALLSVLAGFVIYRSVRGKRRKAAADSSSPAADRDAAEVRPSPEEARSACQATEMSDEGSLDVREDIDLIRSDLKIRHRRAAPEKAPPPYSPRKSDTQVPEIKSTASDDTEEMLAAQDSFKVTETCTEEASQSQSDTHTVAEMVVEDAVDRYQGATDDITEDVKEEVHDNDECLTEPEPISDDNHKAEKTVLKAECLEDEEATTDRNVSDKKNKQEELNFQHALNHSVCFKQPPHTHVNGDDGKLQDYKAPLEANSTEYDSEEPVIYSEDVPISCICDDKEEESKEENPDGVDHSYEQETNLPSTQQDQCDHLMDEMIPPIRDSDVYYNKQEVEDNGLLCHQEDSVHCVSAYQVTEEMLSSESIVVCREECDSVAPSTDVPPLSIAVKTDNHDEVLSDVTIDSKAQIPGISDTFDLSSDYQQPEKEDKTTTTLVEDTDSAILIPQMTSSETENQPDSNKNGEFEVLTEDRNDEVHDPPVRSSFEDPQNVQMIRNEAFDICQDQQSDSRENYKTTEKTVFFPTTDTVVCNDESLTTPSVSEKITHPDVLRPNKDQQSDHTKISEDFSEVTTGVSPVMTEDHIPSTCQINLLSFKESELRINDISSPSVDEESGISSMAVSPDSQETGNEFDMTAENVVLPVVNYDLQSEGQIKAQINLFADDVVSAVIKEATGGMVFGPYPSHRPQPPQSEHMDWVKYESFAANEDMFGHEIEDSYHRDLDQFMAQISTNITTITDELKKHPDMTAAIEVVEIKEKKAPVSVEKKEKTKEEEKEEDNEKTEISIMEATMDNNEWITDNNYQVLPWMNLSAPSFAQDHTKTSHLPTEECHSFALTDTTCIDTTDIPPSTEVKQTSSLSLADENMENNKKVVAVQPMPQNVNVTFCIHYFTQSPYQTVAVTGDQQELGNWKGFIPLERAKDGHWAKVISLPAESHVEWKFVVVDKGEVCRWEECGNRYLDTGCGEDLLVHKWWGLL